MLQLFIFLSLILESCLSEFAAERVSFSNAESSLRKRNDLPMHSQTHIEKQANILKKFTASSISEDRTWSIWFSKWLPFSRPSPEESKNAFLFLYEFNADHYETLLKKALTSKLLLPMHLQDKAEFLIIQDFFDLREVSFIQPDESKQEAQARILFDFLSNNYRELHQVLKLLKKRELSKNEKWIARIISKMGVASVAAHTSDPLVQDYISDTLHENVVRFILKARDRYGFQKCMESHFLWGNRNNPKNGERAILRTLTWLIHTWPSEENEDFLANIFLKILRFRGKRPSFSNEFISTVFLYSFVLNNPEGRLITRLLITDPIFYQQLQSLSSRDHLEVYFRHNVYRSSRQRSSHALFTEILSRAEDGMTSTIRDWTHRTANIPFGLKDRLLELLMHNVWGFNRVFDEIADVVDRGLFQVQSHDFFDFVPHLPPQVEHVPRIRVRAPLLL